jgi:hypothetical protein
LALALVLSLSALPALELACDASNSNSHAYEHLHANPILASEGAAAPPRMPPSRVQTRSRPHRPFEGAGAIFVPPRF